jgi:hypothetical protein
MRDRTILAVYRPIRHLFTAETHQDQTGRIGFEAFFGCQGWYFIGCVFSDCLNREGTNLIGDNLMKRHLFANRASILSWRTYE